MKTTRPAQFIQVNHDEFEEKTSVYPIRPDDKPGLAGWIFPILYESDREGELWYYRYYAHTPTHSSNSIPEKIIIRCNDSYNIVLNKFKCVSAYEIYDFEISNTDAKRIAESTTVEVRAYMGNWNCEIKSNLSGLEHSINQHPCIFATQVIFNYLDNSLYSHEVNEYAQQYKKYLGIDEHVNSNKNTTQNSSTQGNLGQRKEQEVKLEKLWKKIAWSVFFAGVILLALYFTLESIFPAIEYSDISVVIIILGSLMMVLGLIVGIFLALGIS